MANIFEAKRDPSQDRIVDGPSGVKTDELADQILLAESDAEAFSQAIEDINNEK